MTSIEDLETLEDLAHYIIERGATTGIPATVILPIEVFVRIASQLRYAFLIPTESRLSFWLTVPGCADRIKVICGEGKLILADTIVILP